MIEKPVPLHIFCSGRLDVVKFSALHNTWDPPPRRSPYIFPRWSWGWRIVWKPLGKESYSKKQSREGRKICDSEIWVHRPFFLKYPNHPQGKALLERCHYTRSMIVMCITWILIPSLRLFHCRHLSSEERIEEQRILGWTLRIPDRHPIDSCRVFRRQELERRLPWGDLFPVEIGRVNRVFQRMINWRMGEKSHENTADVHFPTDGIFLK